MMGNLSDSQLTKLDNLIYFIGSEASANVDKNDGVTIEQLVEQSLDSLHNYSGDLPAAMDKSEWETLLRQIQSDDILCQYAIQNLEIDKVDEKGEISETYNFCAACFTHEDDVNVIFRGTSSDYPEWIDNGAGGYSEKTIYQERAKKYIEELPAKYGNDLTVSGHSKGGNLSMYVTIMTDRIGQCVAVDGQGFSEEFAREYTARIGMNRDKITLISAQWDFVNPLLYTVAGTCRFLETEPIPLKEFKYNHKPNILLDEDGNLRADRSETVVTHIVQNLSTFVNSCVDDPKRQELIDYITGSFAEDLKPSEAELEGIKSAAFDGIGSYIPMYLKWLVTKPAADKQLKKFSDEHDFETEEAIKKYLREHTGNEYPEYLVRGALLRCRHGSHARRLNLLKDHAVYVRGCPMIHEFNCETADERNISWFGVCKSPCPPTTDLICLKKDPPRDAFGNPVGEAGGTVDGRKCEPFIVSYQWKDTYPKTRIIDNGDLNPRDRAAAEADGSGQGEASVTTLSFLVCNWGGLIEPYTSGQELAEQEAEGDQGDCDNSSQSSDAHSH